MALCYKDKSFCPFYTDCAWAQPGSPDPCDRALTPEVREAARKWWGEDGAPIAEWSEKPNCHLAINPAAETAPNQHQDVNVECSPLPDFPTGRRSVSASHDEPGNGHADRDDV